MTPLKNALGAALSAVRLYVTLALAFAADAFVALLGRLTPLTRRLARSGYPGYLAVFALASLLLLIPNIIEAAREYFDDVRDIAKTPAQYRTTYWE